ncbi:putative myosin-binding protein 5 [Heracleum sosnowskyi]|uniref:Myosin-binding protein 5 n=1 Tax=Heracleum sosnowskyi TaxID=360622 RepID=A0AAD8HBZ4_9APIA|nr:putative myosin-binding protein 5 [Heracleum sosnowskyi]
MSSNYKQFVEDNLGEIPQFIIYAALEMGIICLLYLEAFFAFLSYEFAKFFDLQIPCLLCTRIEHVLLNKDSHFFHNESFCESHKKAVSSLAYCHFHRKISDIKTMCEGCLLSFATDRDSDTDNPKPLVGIIPKDTDGFVEDDHKILLKGTDAKVAEKGSFNRCSCCGEPLTNKSSKKIARSASMKAPNILSNAPASPRPLVTMKNDEGRNLELPFSRFSELKLKANAELELPEDVIGMTPVAGINPEQQQFKEDLKAGTVSFLPDAEDIPDDVLRTPTTKGNKFFGIPLTDATQAAGTPKWANKLAKKVQLEKDFFAEHSDLNPTNEPESETLNRLKRQIRSDRKTLVELSMELDEERSASAIAANNAMAMITRLQAEKAAVQMEALQYQRMMEEQAEYDQEAVQIMKDILVKREGEIKILEAEIETYKEKYGEMKKVGSVECEVDGEEDYQDMNSQSFSSFGEKSECGSPNGHHGEHEHTVHTTERSREIGGGTEEASFDFEGEKSYLIGMLTDLEKKIRSPLDEGTGSSSDVPDTTKKEDKDIENKAVLNREMSLFRERLRAIEADSGFLKHAAMTLQRGSEGTKLLTQIAQHLEKLRQAEKIKKRTDANVEKTENEKAEKRMDTDTEKTEKRTDTDVEQTDERTETDAEKRTDTDALSS